MNRFWQNGFRVHLTYGFHVWLSLLPRLQLEAALQEAEIGHHLAEQYMLKRQALGLSRLETIAQSLKHGALFQLWNHWKKMTEGGRLDRKDWENRGVMIAAAARRAFAIMHSVVTVRYRYAWARWVYNGHCNLKERWLDARQSMLEKHALELIAGRHESGALMIHAIARKWDVGLVQYAFRTWIHIVEQRFLSEILQENKDDTVVKELEKCETRHRKELELLKLKAYRIVKNNNSQFFMLLTEHVRHGLLSWGFSEFAIGRQEGTVARLKQDLLELKFQCGTGILSKSFANSDVMMRRLSFQTWKKITIGSQHEREVDALRQEMVLLKFQAGNNSLSKLFNMCDNGRISSGFAQWTRWARELKFERRYLDLRDQNLKNLYEAGSRILSKIFGVMGSDRLKRGFKSWLLYTQEMTSMTEVEELKCEIINLRMQTGCGMIASLFGLSVKGAKKFSFETWRRNGDALKTEGIVDNLMQQIMEIKFMNGAAIVQRLLGGKGPGLLSWGFKQFQNLLGQHRINTALARQAAALEAKIADHMDLTAMQFLKRNMSTHQSHAFKEWKNVWVDKHAQEMEDRILAAMEGSAMQLLKRILRSREMHGFQTWHQILVGRRADELEAKMLAQMEGNAMQFIKRRLLSQTMEFYSMWKDVYTMSKAEEMEAKMLAMMEGNALQFLKRMLQAKECHSFGVWKDLVVQRKALSMEARLMENAALAHLKAKMMQAAEKGKQGAFNSWKEVRLHAIFEGSMMAKMEIVAVNHLKHVMIQAQSKGLRLAWVEWKDLWTDAQAEKMEMRLLEQMEGKAMQFMKRMLQAREAHAFSSWHQILIDKRAHLIELKLLAQMEGNALQFIKRRLQSQINTFYTEWKDVYLEVKAALMEERLLAQMEGNALQFMKRMLQAREAHAFSAWKDLVMQGQAAYMKMQLMENSALQHLKSKMAAVAERGKTAAFASWKELLVRKQMEEGMLAKLEIAAINHLKHRMASAKIKGLTASFNEWKDIWMHVKAGTMELKLLAQMEGKAVLFLKKMLQAREKNAFSMWHQLLTDAKALELEAKLQAQMEGNALQFVKRRLLSQTNEFFTEWKDVYLEVRAEEMERRLFEQMDGKASQFLKRMLQAREAHSFSQWKDIVVMAKVCTSP